MSNQKILSLLGLALRGGNLTVGEEPVEAVCRGRDARVLLVATDASDNTLRRVRHFAETGQCLWLKAPFTKAELGSAVGRASVAIVAVTDIGLANTVVHRLAESDPQRYSAAAERLEIKAQRAAERRAEQLAHEKNIRTGKVSKKKKAAAKEDARKQQALPHEAAAAAQTPQNLRRSGASRWHSSTPTGKGCAPRPFRGNRSPSRSKADRFAHSRPVKKGKGSFKKKQG